MTSYQFSIRSSKKKDIERIVDLWFESAIYHGELDSRLQVMIDERTSVGASFVKDMDTEDVLFLVATKGEEVIGYINAKVVSAPQVHLVSEMGFIEGMTVTEKYRRQGVGESLYRRALRWFKDQDIGHVRVDVAFNNSEARNFWAKMQFSELSLRLSQDM